MTNNKPNPANPSIRLLALVFTIGTVFGSGLAHGYYKTTSGLNQRTLPDQTEIQQFSHVSRADYERLKLGMSLAAVEAILNRGTEIKRSATTATFVWENADGSRIVANFQDDKLVSKEQSTLK
ncbi:hypothetical protein [Scytonema sp. NUACC21]